MILSVIEYFEFQEWKKANPELYDLSDLNPLYGKFFLFVLTIGIYEMLIKPSLKKTLVRILLIFVVIGYNLAEFIPIEEFDFEMYYFAWFLAIVSFALIMVRITKQLIKKFGTDK